MTFTVTEPIPITPEMVTAHSVVELDPSPLWVSGHAYAKGELAHRAETLFVYRRVTEGAGTTPPEDDPQAWQRFRPVNKFAMWHYYKSTPTACVGVDLVVKFRPGKRVDTLGFYGLRGTAVTIEGHVGAQQVFAPQTRSLQKRFVSGWLGWFTAPFEQINATVFTDLPLVSNIELTVTITASSGIASCQYMVVGRSEFIGDVEWDPQITGSNHSRIERDFDGSLEPGVSLIPRRTVPKEILNLVIPAHNVNRVRAIRDRLNAVPALWNGISKMPDSDYYESVLIFGIYRSLDYSPSNVHWANGSIEVEEI